MIEMFFSFMKNYLIKRQQGVVSIVKLARGKEQFLKFLKFQ